MVIVARLEEEEEVAVGVMLTLHGELRPVETEKTSIITNLNKSVIVVKN